MQVRFRTLGCYPLVAVASDAATLDDILLELLRSHNSDRDGLSTATRPRQWRRKARRLLLDEWLLKPSVNSEVRNYIDAQSNLDLLRFMTCGSVDDGVQPP